MQLEHDQHLFQAISALFRQNRANITVSLCIISLFWYLYVDEGEGHMA